MKSGWQVAPMWASDLTMYRVYRLLDINQPDTEDNREYKEKTFHNADMAMQEAKRLNIEESERFWKGCSR